MKCSFTIEPSGPHTSFTRQQLLREVFEYRTAGCIKKVWSCAGHMFVAVSGIKQLITFDAKTLEFAQENEHKECLDIEEPVLKILSKPPNGVLVVLADGHLQYWTYKQDSKWVCHTKLRLGFISKATVCDVCYNVSQNALYWCEQEVSENDGKITFSINKRQLMEDEDGVRLKLGPVSPLITGCVKCKLYPTGHGITCVNSAADGQVSMVFSLSTLTGHVDVLVDDKRVTLPDLTVHSTLSFKNIIMKSLQYMKKLKENRILESSYIPRKQTVILLLETGKLIVLNHSVDKVVECIKLQDFEKGTPLGLFVEYNHMCLVYPKHIRCYSRLTGDHVTTIEAPEGSLFQGCSEVLLTGLQHFIYTEEQVFVLKKTDVEGEAIERNLLQYGHFQSDAVRVSYIDKMQKFSSESPTLLSRDMYRERWLQDLSAPPTSKLAETVEPFLSEYWRLESMLRDGLQNPQAMCKMDPCSVEVEVSRLLDPKSPVSRAGRQSQLVLLSQQFPTEVLTCLLAYLEITDDELSTSQQQRWQCAITSESCAVGSSCDIAVPLFELVTHLLYKHQPDKLLPFLHCAQRVCDQKVGVSAFARRRHSLQMFERALQCFPEPSTSVDLDTALKVHVHIQLTCDAPGCLLTVIHMLVKYMKWPECVTLLHECRDKTRHFPLLYQIVLSALTKNQVISQYGDRVFSLMPSFNSSDDVMQKNEKDNPYSVQPNVLSADRENNVTVAMVRPHLLKCLHNDEQYNHHT